MGYIMNADETGDPELHIETRRESIVLGDNYNPWRHPNHPVGEQHVFVYGGGSTTVAGKIMNESGSVEVSKVWLAKLLRFFDDPANRERCGLNEATR